MSLADRSAIRYVGDLAEFAQALATDPSSSEHEGIDAALNPQKVGDYIVGLSSDYYWESDVEHRILKVSCAHEGHAKRAEKILLGKKRWETGAAPLTASWSDYRETLRSRKPFKDFLLKHIEEDGFIRYVSVFGMPFFSDDGKFLGYIGASRDVTADIRVKLISELEVNVMQLLAGMIFERAIGGCMRLVCRKLGWRSSSLWFFDDSSSSLWLHDSTELHKRGKDLRVSVEDSDNRASNVVAHVWASRKVLIRTHRTGAAIKPAVPEASNTIAFPLSSREGPFAVMEFHADRIDYPKKALLRFLKHLTAQIGIAYDRHKAADALRESEERFASTFELAAIGLCHVASDGKIVHANQRMIDMLGYSRDELLGKSISEISHPKDRDLSASDIARLERREIDQFELEKRYIHKNGAPIWVRIRTVMRWSRSGRPLYHVSVVEDISERKAAEERIEHLATHDELTGLPNRMLFNELVSRSLRDSERQQEKLNAILFVDLDRFKVVNDSLGHHSGDTLLKTAAKRLTDSISASGCVARFGGDEFVLFLEGLDNEAEAETVAANILSGLHEPLTLREQECRVTASIGIAIYPHDGDDTESLIRNADAAMYAAKQSGKNTFKRYTVDMTPTAVNRIRLESHLRYALERHEFRIHYQRKVDAKTGAIVGVEALLRWWDRELGTISPAQFIPIAEESGLIIPIGKWVLRSACEQQVAWCKRGLKSIRMSVNLSPKQFSDAKLLETVEEILNQTGMDPSCLELEITESMLMSDLDRAIETAKQIRNLGIRLAIDDFGTGYSSLLQLKRIPLDTLKIDRSFVRDLPTNNEDRAITEAIIGMGKTLGVSIVAEGIETNDQSMILKAMQCDELQGFLFGEPCHPDEVAAAIGMAAK